VFAKPSGAHLTDWLARRARAQGRRISPEAVSMLVASMGDDLRMLAKAAR